MQPATTISVIVVIILHLLFLLLEMFLWRRPLGRKIFGLREDFAKASATLAANQGLYNGFLAAGLIWGLVSESLGLDILIFFLSCVIVAGVYGAFTVKKIIFWIQAFPAIIALALLTWSQT